LSCGWTPIQKQRLIELNASDEQQEMLFQDIQERNRTFQELEQQLVKKGKMKLNELKEIKRRPALAELESKLVDVLTEKGFVQVVTPIILAKGLLAKMSIDDNHPLYAQVFWIDEKKCLRPRFNKICLLHNFFITKYFFRRTFSNNLPPINNKNNVRPSIHLVQVMAG
jgi:hypothetical protein